MPPTLGKNVKDIQLSHLKYAVEMINTGYIYRLVKRTSGALEWAGYKVTQMDICLIFLWVKKHLKVFQSSHVKEQVIVLIHL
ncbi:hypothetical protein AB3515_12575 [Acinetobacter baumannii]